MPAEPAREPGGGVFGASGEAFRTSGASIRTSGGPICLSRHQSPASGARIRPSLLRHLTEPPLNLVESRPVLTSPRWLLTEPSRDPCQRRPRLSGRTAHLEERGRHLANARPHPMGIGVIKARKIPCRPTVFLALLAGVCAPVPPRNHSPLRPALPCATSFPVHL